MPDTSDDDDGEAETRHVLAGLHVSRRPVSPAIGSRQVLAGDVLQHPEPGGATNPSFPLVLDDGAEGPAPTAEATPPAHRRPVKLSALRAARQSQPTSTEDQYNRRSSNQSTDSSTSPRQESAKQTSLRELDRQLSPKPAGTGSMNLSQFWSADTAVDDLPSVSLDTSYSHSSGPALQLDAATAEAVGLFKIATLWVGIPLQTCLFTPGLQWEFRGKRRVLQGRWCV